MKRTRIKPMSKKRQALMVQRRHFVKDFLEMFPNCQAQLEGCTGKSVNVHERLNRSQGGTITGEDPNGYLGLCRRCHDHITQNPKMAYELGFSVHRWAS